MTSPSLRAFPKPWLSRMMRWAACGILGFTGLCISTSQTDDAIANGETRTLSLMHKHTGETIHATFRRNGRYDPEVLKKLNWFLRDWRVDEPTQMDPALFDLVWEVYNEVGAEEPIHVVSAYRSPGTNAMLRRRSRAVAKTSQHIQGRAMDFHIPGVSMQRVREVGLMLQRGGVGFYPSGASFVHMDTGSVRHWPKVSREYLARLFPDGRTVHIPADGKPLSGYDLAFAEVRRRGGTVGRGGEDDTEGYTGGENGGVVFQKRGGPNFLTALFGGGETRPEPPVRPLRGRATPAPRPEPAEEPATAVAQAPAAPPPAPGTFGAQLAAQQQGTAPPAMANALLPLANPNAAERPAALAGLVAPLPMARTALPGEAAQPQATTVAMAAMPLPLANPNGRPAPVLPPLIATGAQPPADKPAQVLAYAQGATEIDPLTTTAVQAGAVQSSARALPQTAALRSAPPPSSRTTRSATSAPPLVAPTLEGTRGQVAFAASAKTADVFGRSGGMVRPDPRQLKLIEQPVQIVAISFTQHAGLPATDRFSGSAVNPIPTMQFVKPEPVATTTQRRAALESR